MRRIKTLTLLLSATLVGGTAAWAHDDNSHSQESGMVGEESSDSSMYGEEQSGDEAGMQGDESGMSGDEAGMSGEESGMTTAGAEEVTRGTLRSEAVGFKPQVGVLVFDDPQNNGDTTSRAAYGFTLDMNAMRFINENLANWYLGPSTGLIYSHLGSSGANFFGADSPTGAPNAGANFFQIPLNLKAGYTFGDSFRLAVHGGGNIVYRSIGQSLALGDNAGATDSDWNIFPNVGADIEFGLGQNIALTLRPDVTLTPGDELYTGTLALAIPIG